MKGLLGIIVIMLSRNWSRVSPNADNGKAEGVMGGYYEDKICVITRFD